MTMALVLPRVPTLEHAGKAVAWCVEPGCDWRSAVTEPAAAARLAAEHRAGCETNQGVLW